MRIRGSRVSIDPSGLAVVTEDDAQGVVAELDAAVAAASNFDVGTSDPGSPATGYAYINTDDNVLRLFTGSAWASIALDVDSALYGAAVLADSPWGYWRLTETSGTTLQDETANNRDLTISGSAHTLAQTGPKGDAIDWANATGHAETTATFASSAATLESWVKIAANPSASTVMVGMAASFGDGTFDKQLFIDSAGKPGVYLYTGSILTLLGPSALSTGTWHHIAATVGAAGVKLYVDGTEVATDAATSSYSGAQLVFVRGGGNGYTATGAMLVAEPAVYAAQLSAARVLAHYNAASG